MALTVGINPRMVAIPFYNSLANLFCYIVYLRTVFIQCNTLSELQTWLLHWGFGSA